MRSVIIGAGPIGMFTAMALARRGHDVTVVDRDPGPAADGTWERQGVMQFMHPHFFRPQLRMALAEELPDVLQALLDGGARVLTPPGAPEIMAGLALRRLTLERVLRECTAREPGVTLLTGHAEDVVLREDRVESVVVDGAAVPADIVISCAGRASRFGRELRGEPEGGPCGISYVTRMYRAREGSPECEIPFGGEMAQGYQTILFPQDDKTFSVLFCRPSADELLAESRHEEVYEAITRVVPHTQPWTDLDRFEPITPVMVGGRLDNSFALQGKRLGEPPAEGLYFIGDAVCTTNPSAGRGVALGIGQARALLELLDDDALSPRERSVRLEEHTLTEVKPWYEDHVHVDAKLLERQLGADLDVEDVIPTDVIAAAAEHDPSLMEVVGPYLGMFIGPQQLRSAAEERARAVLRTGWRPPWSAGPTRDELVELVGLAR